MRIMRCEYLCTRFLSVDDMADLRVDMSSTGKSLKARLKKLLRTQRKKRQQVRQPHQQTLLLQLVLSHQRARLIISSSSLVPYWLLLRMLGVHSILIRKLRKLDFFGV